ncbi:MAG TPA: GNAT family N-acetyltransferase [Ruminiclostridium sp.]
MIRSAKENDINPIYELICQLENTEFDKGKFSKTFTQNRKDENIYYFVAEENSQVVGFISLIILSPLHHCDIIAEVAELVVADNMQGIGIGKQLLQYAENKAKELMATQIELSSNQKRVAAHRFYKIAGYGNTHFKLCKVL